jgi:outer membrane receptor protein involved in Fe transport
MLSILPFRKSVWASVAIISLFTPRVSHSQIPTAKILGVVKDSSSAVVPDVALIVRNVDTGLSRTTTTSENGSFQFLALPVGAYEVRAEHPGFRSEVRSGITLTVSQEAVVNLSLQVGSVEETVSVTADAQLVNTTSGTLGGLVNEQKVVELPLNGRNFMDLTLLQPGIVHNPNQSGGAIANTGIFYSSNGAPVRSNSYLLDGAPMTNQTGVNTASANGSSLGIGGVREYRVITNSFSAEYGMTMGSQVIMVSKGGTNQFHGELFGFLRNSALDARNYFDYPSVASKKDFRLPAFKRNQFGFSGGGPIRLDKTFFYAAYEGLRERLGITTIDTFMGASCHGTANTTISNSACPQLGTTSSATISPVVAPLLALYPDPNLPNNQFTFPFTQPTREDYGQIRMDQTFSANDSLFGRYTVDDVDQTNSTSHPDLTQLRTSRSQYATFSQNHIFTPTLLNTARFSFSRMNPTTTPFNPFSGPQYTFVPGLTMGSIGITGLTGIGPGVPARQKQFILTWSDDLFYTRGQHSLKLGTLVNRYQTTNTTATGIFGSVNFTSLANFLSGVPNTYSAITPGSILTKNYHYATIGFYAQDDVKLLPTLTLNLGLRYEFQRVPREADGLEAALRDAQHDAATTVGPVFENMSLRNFSPRFGFAWDVFGNGATALRGGFAELFDIGVFGQVLNIGTTGTPPFSSNSSVTNPTTFTLPLFFPPSAIGKTLRTQDYHMEQPHLLSYNLTLEHQLPASMAVRVAYAGSRGINILQTKEGNPTVPQGLPNGSTCIAASPAPAFSTTEPRCWTGTDPRTNPNWAGIEFKTAGGSSWYNSLQFTLMKQLSHNLQFESSYTWGKLIDETQGQATGDNTAASLFGADPSRRNVDRGLADFDLTQSWRFNAIYELASVPVEGILDKVLNGWRLSGIVRLQDGLPFTPAIGSNRSRSGVNNGGAGIDRPDLEPGRNGANTILGAPERYFDPSAFTLQPAGFLGNAGRNILRGPGLANVDFSLVKNAAVPRLGESGKFEFRVEFFNILNRANFADPNRTVFSGTAGSVPVATAGLITSTITASRQIQFAMKVLF